MKTKALILILSACSLFSSFAQTGKDLKTSKKADVKFGPELTDKGSTISGIVGCIGDNYYALRTEQKGLVKFNQYLDKIDGKLKKTKSVLIKGSDEKRKDKYVMGTIIANDHFYLMFSKRGKKETTISVNEVDPESLKLDKDKVSFTVQTNNPSMIIAPYGIGLGKRLDELFENGFDVSQDGSKILIYQSNYSVSGTENEDVALYVYDDEFSAIWEKRIAIPYSSELFTITDAIVDNAGNVHLLGKEYDEVRKNRKKGKPNYKYHLISYMGEGENIKDNIISLGEDFITDISINVIGNNLLAAGFYSEEKNFTGIKGVFYLNMDIEAEEIVSKSQKDFSIDFIVENLKESKANKAKDKAAKGKNVELASFDLDEMISREDGGSILLAEKFYVTTHTYTTSNGGTRTRTIYHYDDIIAVSISPEGQIEWTHKIPKSQSSGLPGGYASYASAVCNENLYLIFNDNSKNIIDPKTKGGAHHYRGATNKESIVSIVEMGPEGSFTREVLYTPGKTIASPFPHISENGKHCELVLYNRVSKKQMYSKVTFQE